VSDSMHAFSNGLTSDLICTQAVVVLSKKSTNFRVISPQLQCPWSYK